MANVNVDFLLKLIQIIITYNKQGLKAATIPL